MMTRATARARPSPAKPPISATGTEPEWKFVCVDKTISSRSLNNSRAYITRTFMHMWTQTYKMLSDGSQIENFLIV